MTNHYRIYPIDKRDRIGGSHDAICDDDAQAITYAAQIITPNGQVEIWSNSRLVGRFPTLLVTEIIK